MVKIQVLGTGCANCHKVEALAQQATAQLGVEAEVTMVTDGREIMRYGILGTPGLVVNGQVVSAGRVPALSQITTMLTAALGQGGE